MATIGRKQPAGPPDAEQRPRPRTVTPGTEKDNSRLGRFRTNANNILAELNKVTWPTREETRNLTIVVIGISAVIGGMLGILDFLLSLLYSTLTSIF